ncbi:MAG: NTP transferase domain-containing protein [Phycisphaerales bacterium]|nr:NTP transferase domain-containing protein [Phycisphaerales bacterium]
MTPSTAQHPGGNPPAAIILAAGKGTRMQSDLPKVLHEVGGRPMVCAVIDACRAAGCSRIVLVVGYMHELVRQAVAACKAEGNWGSTSIEFAMQPEQLGTGHAVQCTRDHFLREAREPGHDVFVLAGDGPLIRSHTLNALLELHRSTGSLATLATSVIDDPAGYGRIVRDAARGFSAIVEHKDATPAQRAIREINPSYYCFDVQSLFSTLLKVTPNAGSGEYYVTDVPGLLLRSGRRVELIDAVSPEDVLSINTPEQLAEVDRIYRSRLHSQPPRIGGKGAA